MTFSDRTSTSSTIYGNDAGRDCARERGGGGGVKNNEKILVMIRFNYDQ